MSKKDKSIKIRICVLNKQNTSINYSIRLKDGVTIDKAIEKSVQFLKQTL